MHNRACFSVTWNCQLKLSAHDHLNEYVNPFLKTTIPSSFWCQCLSWLGPPFPWRILSVLFLINLFLLTCKNSYSSLRPYQELMPTKEGPGLPSPNPITLGIRSLYWPGRLSRESIEVTKGQTDWASHTLTMALPLSQFAIGETWSEDAFEQTQKHSVFTGNTGIIIVSLGIPWH